MTENLSVEFIITADDIVKWNEYLLGHNPVLKSYMLKITWGVAIALIVAGAIISTMMHNAEAVIVGSISAVFYIPAIRVMQKRRVNLLRRALAEGNNKATNGKRILTITDDGLVGSTEAGDGTAYWKGIERIVEIPGYTFIDLGAMNAFVIPEQRVEDGDYPSFVAEIKRRWEESQKEQVIQ